MYPTNNQTTQRSSTEQTAPQNNSQISNTNIVRNSSNMFISYIEQLTEEVILLRERTNDLQIENQRLRTEVDSMRQLEMNQNRIIERLNVLEAQNERRDNSIEELRNQTNEIISDIDRRVEEISNHCETKSNELSSKIDEVKDRIQSSNFAEKVEIDNLKNEIEEKYVKNESIPITLKEEKYLLSYDNIAQLEKMTNKKCGAILFDSNKDNWSENDSVFNERIIGKKQLVFLIEDMNGEIYGYYLNTEIVEKYNDRQATDTKSFQFNLQSNGRLPGPMKFEIKDLEYGGIWLNENSDCYLINLSGIVLNKKQTKEESQYHENLTWFEYDEKESVFCGKKTFDYFTPKRIVVIQMNMTPEQIELENQENNLEIQRKLKLKELKDTLSDEIKKLERRTNLMIWRSIFDSDVDDWSYDTTNFYDRIIGKSNLLFLIEDEDGEIFGYYGNKPLKNRNNEKIEYHYCSFLFNLRSKDYRLKGPMIFESTNNLNIEIKKYGENLITLGDMKLRKNNIERKSCCWQVNNNFNYQGIKNALRGKRADQYYGEQFTPKRIVVIQMNYDHWWVKREFEDERE